MSTTTNIEDDMDTGNIDMQPLDDSSFSEDPLPDTADTEGVSEYEMSDDGTVVDDPEAVEVTTLEDTFFIGMRNDLSFVVGLSLNMYEHQSTKNFKYAVAWTDLFHTGIYGVYQ